MAYSSMDGEIYGEGNMWSTAQCTKRSMVRQCVGYSSIDGEIYGEGNVWSTAQSTMRSMVRAMCGVQFNGQIDPW